MCYFELSAKHESHDRFLAVTCRLILGEIMQLAWMKGIRFFFWEGGGGVIFIAGSSRAKHIKVKNVAS